MIDKNKIKSAAQGYCDATYGTLNINPFIAEAFRKGANWAINEFIKELFHPASEVPRNDNGKVLAFSKEYGYRKIYDMNDELDKTTCDTYQQMWKEQVNIFHLSDWIFADELFDLVTKGCNHD